MKKIKSSVTIHKILFILSTIGASLALLMLALNIIYLNSSLKELSNIGLMISSVVMVMVAISQYLELRK